MGVTGGPNIIRDSSLVLELDAADRNSYPGSGTIWRDLTANNYTGSLVNGPTFSSANLGSIVFDGVNDYCLTNYTDTPVYFTFECIFKFNTISGTNVVVAKYNNTGNDYWMGTFNTSDLVFSTNASILNSNFSVSTSSYNFITCIIGASSKQIYINGILRNSSSTVLTSPGGGITLASFGQAGGFYSNVNIANFKFYNRALSPTEILQNYNALKPRFNL
jgi:hypothetical protein